KPAAQLICLPDKCTGRIFYPFAIYLGSHHILFIVLFPVRVGVAVRRSRTTMARNALSGGPADVEIMVGAPDDVAVVGDWLTTDQGPRGAGVSLWRPRPG
ncbi:MAG: hypothetical protein ACO1PW_11905, partial [Actinomycetota bacterium]